MTEDDALQQLASILARPEYHVDDSVPWWQTLLNPVLNSLWSIVAQLYRLILDSATGREGALGLTALVLSAIVLGAAAVYLVRAVRLSVLRETAPHSASLAARRQRSDQLWAQAQQLASAGRLSEAVRPLYLSALYALDERAVLHLELALTNGEHARTLTERYPALGRQFGELVQAYEQVRYGGAPIREAGFDDLAAHAQSLRAAALQPTAPA